MDTPNSPNQPLLVENLTERELDVLRLKAQNRSNQEIADELVLALSTVKWYVRQIYGKLGVENRRQAVARAQALGLIEGPPTPSIRPHHNLPAQTTPFIGRAQECADLDALLADPDVRLITILAPGGMGKTRLGLAVAEAHLDRFADGVYMVPLAPLRSVDQIVTAIAEGTSFPFMPNNRTPKQQVLDFLRHKHMLLLLDNFEHLLDTAGLLAEMLEAAPAVQVVVTSRERLNLSGEAVHTVVGMGFPEEEIPGTYNAFNYDAVQLFMQRAELASPGLELPPDDLRYLARICRLVEGMPLGIVLAAAWTEVLSLEEIADEIQGSFDFLAAEMRDVPRRQWSIRAVFEPTWNRLTDSERDAFMRFSVFRGGCTREAAQAVTEADLRTIQVLINKALLDRDPAGRYQVHELLRQYAQQQLEAAGEMDATRDAHSAVYAEFMGARVDDLKGGDRQLIALDEIEGDFDNVQAAWTWALERRQTDDLLSMEWALWNFLGTKSRFVEGCDLFQAALAVAQDRMLHGRLLARYGSFLALQLEADDWLRESLAIARETNDLATLAFVLRMRASFFVAHHRDFEQAFELADECLTLYQQLANQWGVAWALHAKGYVAYVAGETRSSLEFSEQALEIRRQIGDRQGIAGSLLNIGCAYGDSGDYRKAQQYYEKSLAVARELGMSGTIGDAVNNLGVSASGSGDYPLAVQRFQEAIDISTEFGHPAPNSRMNLARNLALMGRFDEVDKCLEELAFVMQSVEPKLYQWTYRIVQSLIAYTRADVAEALRFAHTALEYAQMHDFPDLESQSWLRIGICEVKLGQVEAAQLHLLWCLPDLKEKSNISEAIYGLAEVAAAQSQTEQAVELATLVYHHPITWHEFKVYAEALLADLEATLPQDAYAAAVERGKALDLDAVAAELLADSAE